MADFTYILKHPIDKDGGGTITQLEINRPTMADINAVDAYFEDNIQREIWIARLLIEITDPALSVAEAGRLDLADCVELLHRYHDTYTANGS